MPYLCHWQRIVEEHFSTHTHTPSATHKESAREGPGSVVVVVVVLGHKELVLLQEGGHLLADPGADAEAGKHGEEDLEQSEAHLATGLLQHGAGLAGRSTAHLEERTFAQLAHVYIQ